MFAESVSHAPIILETHDIYTDLIRSHGIPEFVPQTPTDSLKTRREEEDSWARAAVCVKLSPEDHAIIAKFSKRAVLARPYVRSLSGSGRQWAEIVKANRLRGSFLEAGEIDILLWGSMHQGNVDSINWFVDKVLTADEALADARIVVAGRVIERLESDRLAARGV